MLNVNKGEGLLVLTNLILFFYAGFVIILTGAIASAVFLEHYSPENVPFIFVASSILMPIIGYLHVNLSKRISFLRMQYLTLAFLTLMSGFFFVSFKLFDTGMTGAALFVWFYIQFSLCGIVSWGVAKRLMSIRQGKRLFGLITIGRTVAIIAGGLATPLLISMMGTPNLLVLVLGAHVVGIITLIYMGKQFSASFEGSQEKQENNVQSADKTSITPIALLKQKYTLIIFAYFALMAYVCDNLVDTIFFYELNNKYSSADELAGFIAQFGAYCGIAGLIFRLTIGRKWMEWFGVRGTLLTAPIVLGVIALIILSVGNMPAMLFLLFPFVVWLAFLNKFFLGATGQPVYNSLYQTLSPEKKAVAQTTAETMIGPISGGLTAIFLLVLTKGIGVTSVGLTGIAVPIIGIWILVSWLADRGYKKELESALTRRGFDNTEIDLNDPYCIKIINKKLRSVHKAEVLYCLDLASGVKQLEEHLIRLATHEDPEVRRRVYMEFETCGENKHYHFLVSLLENEQHPAAREMLLRAVAAAGEGEAFELLAASLESEDSCIRRRGLVGLIRYGGIEGAVNAGGRLLDLEKSEDRHERLFAAEVLGEIGIPSFYRGLTPLFEDMDSGVRCAAIQAAGKLKNPRLLKSVMKELASPETRDVARNVLLEAGEKTLPYMETALETTVPPKLDHPHTGWIANTGGNSSATQTAQC